MICEYKYAVGDHVLATRSGRQGVVTRRLPGTNPVYLVRWYRNCPGVAKFSILLEHRLRPTVSQELIDGVEV